MDSNLKIWHSRTLFGLVLAGALAALGPADVRAQAPSNVDCNKCVDTRDIAKKAVNRSRLRNGAVTGNKIRDSSVSQSKLDFDVATQDELDDLQAQVDDLAPDQGDILSHLLPKTVFVTSGAFTGNLGGLAGADVICQAAADDPAAVVPSGDYVAWLSTSTVDARDRITQTLGPYVRADGAVIVKSYADLINAENADLLSGIELDESGSRVTALAWTGTGETGIRALVGKPDCSDWTSASPENFGFGVSGTSNLVTFQWTRSTIDLCDASSHLYCFQR